MSNKISFFSNPFYLQGLIWIIVIAIYSLGWSDLFPKLSYELSIFFLIIIFLYFTLGYLCQRRRLFPYKSISFTSSMRINIVRSIKILYILLFIEIVSTSCPLWNYISTGETDYTEFGLPFIHVIVVAGFTIICWFSFQCYISTKERKNKRKLFISIILCFIPFILIFNRGGIMSMLLGMGLTYLMSVRVRLVHVCYSIITILIIFWFFGVMGDVRTDSHPNQHIILELGGASDDFKNSFVPPEYYWGYIYIISPLGNVQNNINQTKEIEYSLNSLGEMILFDFMPVIISKRVSAILEIEEKQPALVVPNLNVSTVYKNSYNYLGWIGLGLMFLFSIFFVLITIGLANKKSPLYTTLLVSINVIILMNLFNNMFIYMGLVPIPFVLLLLSRKYKITKATTKNRLPRNTKCL